MNKHLKDVTIADLATLSTKDLLAVYNHHAAKPIDRFSDHPTAFGRTKKLLSQRTAKTEFGLKTLPPPPGKTITFKTAMPKSKKARNKVLVAPLSQPDSVKEYHSVLAAFKALGLPVEKHQRFRRQVKLNGKANIAQFIFVATY